MVDALPLYDLVIDVPHPVVDAASDKPVFIGSPSEAEEDVEIQNDIHDSMPDISCLAFPEYDSSVVQEIDDKDDLAAAHRFQRNHLEKPGFSHFTFSIKVQSGSLVYAHVRRYLPAHRAVPFRYDIGRRLGRALASCCFMFSSGHSSHLLRHAIITFVDSLAVLCCCDIF